MAADHKSDSLWFGSANHFTGTSGTHERTPALRSHCQSTFKLLEGVLRAI